MAIRSEDITTIIKSAIDEFASPTADGVASVMSDDTGRSG